MQQYPSASYRATAFNYGAIEDEKGVLFFANESGVLRYDGSQWKLISLDNFAAANALLLVGERIYVGGRNELGYLEKDSTGLYSYKSLRHLVEIAENEALMDIWQVVRVGNDIYFCSWKRLFRYDGRKINIIPGNDAFVFKINQQLFASTKDGLAKVFPDRLEYVNKSFTFENDMAFQYLRGLQGENFIVTADNGIYHLDTVTFRTRKWDFPASKQLEENSIYHVVIWPDSLYSISTYLGGLIMLDSEGKVVKTYTKQNGFLGNELRELLIDKRGNLWVTSDHGINYLKLPYAQVAPSKLVTYIDQITVDEEEIGIAACNSYTTPVDFDGSVVFHFATPGFDQQELEYSYYLEGFDQAWSGWKSEVKKEYTNLDGGNYTFHAKARYGNVESEMASASLVIPISWYRTPWAYGILTLVLAASLGYGIRYRTRRLEVINERLESIIQARTEELEQQRQQLEISNSDLTIINTELDNFVYRSSHDLVAPLKSLKGLINISEMETDASAQREYFNMMRLSIDKLEDFIKSIMEYSSNNKKAVVREEISLTNLLDDIVSDLKYFDRADRIELIRSIDDGLKLRSDPRRLKVVLSNLITNSIKYHNYEQENLFIEVKSKESSDTVQLDIIDNGSGIEEEHLENIFEMFFRATESSQGSGLGLYIVRDTVRKLGGEIYVKSKKGVGTTFSVVLPKSDF